MKTKAYGFSQDGNEDVVDVDECTDEDEAEVIPDDDEDIEKVFVQEDKKLELNVGMTFDSVAELFEYYLKYGNENGFPVKKRSSRIDDDGEVRWVAFACSRSGKTESTSRNAFKLHPTTKTECNARVRAALCPNGKWRVSSVALDHNHVLSPGKSRFYKRNRCLKPSVKRRLELNDMSSIKPSNNFHTFVTEAGGHEKVPFLEKDCRNHLDKVRRLRLGNGDGAAVENYFAKMKANNSNFFSLMDLDKIDGRIKNIFWADARSRAAYEEFGDAITFDTTYLTNKYDMPFAPFVGVNHHGQSILLGCALISKQDTVTFSWVFQTWLQCMGGRAPNAIITDQDRAMQNAIGSVFPNTRHRWCLWHIMKKLPEKLHPHKEYESIKFAMQHAVYESVTIDDFEESWKTFIEKFDLKKNDWLNGLYEEKTRWVPVFVKDIFWAGMSTTQRSESMNSFFDGYVNSKTTLKQFVEQYENALRSKVEKENQADFISFNSRVPCITHYRMEKHFQDGYTTAKFKEFQTELTSKIYCDMSQVKEECGVHVYEILEDKGWDRQTTFTVSLNLNDLDIKCNCRLFEFRGILCRHALTVLIHRKVQKVPETYILRRWRKDVRRQHTKVKISYFDWLQNPDNERYDRMCKVFYEAADLATHNEAKTRLVVDRIKSLCKELNEDEGAQGSSLPNSLPGTELHDRSSSHDTIPMCKQNGIVRSPLAIRRNIGRPPFKRKESKGDQAVRKKKEQEKKVKEKEKDTGAGSVFGNLNFEKDPTGGLEVIELGGTQESITMKDHGRNAPHASHPYNSIGAGFAGFPLHLQDTGGTFPFRHGSHPNNYIDAEFPLHVQENGDNFPPAYPPNNFLGVNFPLQIPSYHYPFWSGGDMPFSRHDAP